MFINQLPTIYQKCQTCGSSLELINVLIATGTITRTVTLVMVFCKPAEGANPYIQFGYGPLNIFNHTRGQFLGSLDADPINMIHANQKLTKEGLNKYLEGYFINSKNNT